MQNKPSYLAILISAALLLTGLTSCGDIEQNLVLNTNGSGTLETTFDMGEMMSMIKGLGDMGSMMNDDVTISADQPPVETPTEPEEAKDPMQLIIDKVTDPAYAQDYDTLFSITEIMPDSVRQKVTRPDLLKKINIRLQSPAESSSLKMGLVMHFDNKAELAEMVDYLETLDDSSSTGILPGMGGGMQSETFLVFDADLKAGWIKVDSVDLSGLASNMEMGGEGTTMGGEDMGMMEMMFANSKIKTSIKVPGEVTSCSNKDAILTKDNRVLMEYNFMDVYRKGKLPGYSIQFTPVK